MKPATLRKAKAFVLKWGIAFTVLMLGLWPALSLPAGMYKRPECAIQSVLCHVGPINHLQPHTTMQAPPSPSPTLASGSGSGSSGDS